MDTGTGRWPLVQVLAACLVVGAMATACAVASPQDRSAASVPVQPMGILIVPELALDDWASIERIAKLSSATTPDQAELSQLAGKMADDITATLSTELPKSACVRWALSRPVRQLTPDHVLRLRVRSLEMVPGREEGTEMPRVHLDVELTRSGDSHLLLQETVWVTGLGSETKDLRQLDLHPLYIEVARKVTRMIEVSTGR